MGLKFRRLACVCLTAVMGVSLGASHALALANSRNNLGSGTSPVKFEEVTGKMDLSSIILNNLSQSVLENAGLSTVSLSKTADYTVIVELDESSVLEAAEGNASDYLATYQGRNKLNKIRNSQTSLLNGMKSAGIQYTFKRSYTTVINALAVTVNYSNLEKLVKIPGVKNIVLSSAYEYPKTVERQSASVADNPSNVYGTGIYKSEDIIKDYNVDGSGVAVAILDTGLDYSHEAFTSYLPEEVRYTKSDIADKINSAKTSTNPDVRFGAEKSGAQVTADDVYISAKVPFAYDYADDDADVYPSYSNHGTHVAGIVAGQADSYKNKDGKTELDAQGNPVPFRGVAPNAQLVICKVFTDDFDSEDLGGAVTEDILAALDDCVNLGVDVINMSLGTSAGFSSISIKNDELGLDDTEGEAMNRVYNRIKDAGISLICAASNDFSSGYGSAFGTNLASNPDSGTVGSPSTFDGAVSVASINGQLARYMTVEQNGEDKPVYYLESSDENSVQYDFLGSMFEKYGDGGKTLKVKYVIVPGRGESVDYTYNIQKLLQDKTEGPVIAVVKRGKSTFKEKIQLAMDMNADGVILCNNVAGSIRMSLGDIKNPVPAVSVTMDAGTLLSQTAVGGVGYLTLNEDFQAGPFMNDYSSWGTTSDLKLKPDVTAHGGEITSTVPGGYNEQSGTSMASPNLAGFVALLRSYVKRENPEYASDAQGLTRLVNQLTMSTATIVNDQDLLPYSPRKQGSGLATLSNAFSSKAYLSTVEGVEFGAEDNRPKIELGEDKEKKGEYTFSFYVNNFGGEALEFELGYKFMTETLSSDGLSVAEKARLLTDNGAKWTVNGESKSTGDTVSVPAGTTGEQFKITVTVSLSDAEKKYIDSSFANGMFVEGFITLTSKTKGQCGLSLPFMGFYGDWSSAPMLDYDCYEISKFQQDTSLTDDKRPQAQVWATQCYAEYFNHQFSVPMGSYMYALDESADKIYTNEDYAAVSCYNEYIDAESAANYLSTTSVKALYAGLLRNAEVVQYTLSDAVSGEIIKKDYNYRVNKAYANGGSPVPANVELELSPAELGLVNNGKYKLEFAFYFRADDVGKPVDEDDTFSMVFYVDYEAPVLEDARIRYYDYKDGNKDKQRIYLDLDIYDNHYAQSVILCYADASDPENTRLLLATEYITPVYNAVKNGTTTVSIEITDIYEKYKRSLYVQLDDYALNHSVYQLQLSDIKSPELPSSFEIKEGTELTIGLNQNYKLGLEYEGSANLSDFTWGSDNPARVKVQNGEIFGASVGSTYVTVSNGSGVSRRIKINVEDKGIVLPLPNISFSVIETAGEGLKAAKGAIPVYAGQNYTLDIITDPWYYPISNLTVNWESSNEKVAKVVKNNANGTSATVTTLGEEGTASITAVVYENGVPTLYATSVTMNVRDPFTVNNFVLTDYNGPGGVVKIPDDENILYIGEEAFKDDKTIECVIIPKTVVEIRERAFAGCTNLKKVYFINTPDDEDYESDLDKVIPDSNLSVINKHAFRGCTSLELVDLTNVKVATLAYGAFYGCTSLKEVVKMKAIGTMNAYAFANCSSLVSADITNLHTAREGVFSGCTSLREVINGEYSAIGDGMFSGCRSLETVQINVSDVGARAFYGCANLRQVTFGVEDVTLGDQAFFNCPALTSVTLPAGEIRLGDQVFPNGISVTASGRDNVNGAIYEGNKLLIAPSLITSEFSIRNGTVEIAPYAFAGSTLANGVTGITVPDSVTTIGEGAFAHLQIKSITLPANLEEIPDYAFYGCSPLTGVTIPVSVSKIGVSAFEGCIALASVNDFGKNVNLISVGDRAFVKCEALTSVTFPENVKVIGDEVFAGCSALREVNFPALEKLGEDTFGVSMEGGYVSFCGNLQTVTFAPEAKTIGVSTFFPGAVYDENNMIRPLASKLTSVTLPAAITEIGDYAFYYCSKLESINLQNVTKVGDYAFANCTALTVEGLANLTDIGDYAFTNCFALQKLDLTNAVNIGDYAFDMADGKGSFTEIKLVKAENIGNYAFFGGKETSVTLPSCLKTLGFAAFTGSPELTQVNISDNALFRSEDGILYRNVTDASTGKVNAELMVYPAGKKEASFTVPEGTISIAPYAFADLGDALKQVTLPYTLKTIGAGAFLESGITEYIFKSYNAPVLLSENRQDEIVSDKLITSLQTYFTLYYNNFENNFIDYSTVVTDANRKKSTLKITYPANGTGYDNYIYARYFGIETQGAEVLEDTTAEFKSAMDALVAEYGDIVAEVKGWQNLEVNEANKAIVSAFSDRIKDAHRLYNNITSQSQLELLNEGKEGNYYYNLLASVEEALKPVKAKFGIAVKTVSIALSPDSNYRTEYKEGEAFDKTGLLIIVTYDDYSTVIITADDIKVTSSYAESLTELDKYVMIEYEGVNLRIPVTVTAGEGGTGCNTTSVVLGCVGGAVGLLAVAGAVILVIFMRKRKAGSSETEVKPVEKEKTDAEENNENKDEN